MQTVPPGPGEPYVGSTIRQSLQEFNGAWPAADLKLKVVTRLATDNHAPNNENSLNEGLISAIVHE